MNYKAIMKYGRGAFSMVLSAVFAVSVASSVAAAPKKDKYLFLTGSTPQFAAPVVAVEKGWCKDMGLDVEIRKFTSGGVAAQSFIAGQGDFMDTGDWPAVRTWLLTQDKDDPIVGLAPDAYYGDLTVIMAKSEIKDPKQLKGKKIGVWLGTTSEFFAGLYLDKHGVPLDSVKYVNVQPAEMVPALDSGDLDAFVMWQPFGWKSQEVSGNKVHELSTAEGYFTEFVVVSTHKSLLDNDPDAAKVMIQCMKKGGEWAAKNQQEASKIVGDFFKIPPETVMKMISVMNMDPTFSTKFRKDMDDLNNFMMSKDQSKSRINWNKHFDARGLETADPMLVK
jgi:ABC-type nitrate/sulfonate/bicarbonate transport system substrate-binding protein